MKRLFKIVTAAALIASGFLFGSCEDEEVVNVLTGPKNTWCTMPVQYKTSDDETAQTASLYAHFYYTDSAKTVSGVDFPAGLSIVVTALDNSQSEIIQGLSNTAYILKSFPKDVDTEVSGEEGEAAIKVNGSVAKWTAIYWAKEDLHNKNNQSTTPPTQLANGTNLGEDGLTNFSWKRLLANYLLNILEE